MRQLSLVLAIFVCIQMRCVLGQEISPELAAPEHVLASGEPIDVKRTGHSAPFFGDIDGDGLKDLIVGEYFEGRVRVFKNQGTPGNPQFSNFEWISTESGNAKVPSD